MSAELLNLRVTQIRCAARDVLVLTLCNADAAPLPGFTPGAHLDVHLAEGIVRQYSLCNDSRQADRYEIGVGLAPASRGGSRYIHQCLKVGDWLRVSVPRNHFPLVAEAPGYVFFAGGIGITPIHSMIQWCEANQRPWHLYYLVRSRERAAFIDTLAPFAERVTLHADEAAGGLFDVAAAVASQPRSHHLYTCGPQPLMKAVEAAARDWPPAHVHFEWFVPKRYEPVRDATFTVTLRRSGLTLEVPPDKSILEVLEAHGVRVENSCREGTCASCETRVIAGIPEHRDSVLSDDEKQANDSMMICVSRARSSCLELDL